MDHEGPFIHEDQLLPHTLAQNKILTKQYDTRPLTTLPDEPSPIYASNSMSRQLAPDSFDAKKIRSL